MVQRTTLLDRIAARLNMLARAFLPESDPNHIPFQTESPLRPYPLSKASLLFGLLFRLTGMVVYWVRGETPGIDWADPESRTAFIITDADTHHALRPTLTHFSFRQSYDRLIAVVMSPSPLSDVYIDQWDIDLDLDRDVWTVHTLLSMAESITDTGRLASIADFLDSELDSQPGRSARVAHPLPCPPLSSVHFVPGSRDKELERLNKRIAPGTPVFIRGMAGMGKTELAIQLANLYPPSGGAYLLSYRLPPDGLGEAMRETILNADFAGYAYDGPEDPDREQEYRQRLEILRSEYRNTLLIIDGFDWPGRTLDELLAEQSCRDLAETGVRLVFTTRSATKKPGVEVGPLSDEALLRAMRQTCGGVSVSDEQLLTLIRLLDSHTLTALLAAKTLAAGGTLPPEKMPDLLRSGGLTRTALPTILFSQAGVYQQTTLYSFLRQLVHAAFVSHGAETILHCAALLPPEGMDARFFRECLPRDQWQDLQWLTDQNWIRQKQGSLYIPAVARLLCLERQERLNEFCGLFLDILWNRFDIDHDRAVSAQLAACYSMAATRPFPHADTYAHRAARLWELAGDPQKALPCALQWLAALEKAPQPDKEDLAAAYLRAGRLCGSLNNHLEAREYRLKALTLLDELLPPESPDLAAACFDLALTCAALEDHVQALDYHLKALNIRKRVLSSDHPDLERSTRSANDAFRRLSRR